MAVLHPVILWLALALAQVAERPMAMGVFGRRRCQITALADNGHTLCGTAVLAAHFDEITVELRRSPHAPAATRAGTLV